MAKISIRNPTAFRRSVRDLKKDGLAKSEKTSIRKAQALAKAQMKRKDISSKEKKQFKQIANMNIRLKNRPFVSNKKGSKMNSSKSNRSNKSNTVNLYGYSFKK